MITIEISDTTPKQHVSCDNYPFGCNGSTPNAPWNAPEIEEHECGDCIYYDPAPFVNADCGVCLWEGHKAPVGSWWVLETEEACEGWR